MCAAPGAGDTDPVNADHVKLTPEAAVKGTPEHIQDAWRILAGGAPVAAAALVDIAEHGNSELARVQASTAILDRVGLAPPKEIHHRVVPHEVEDHAGAQLLSPAEVIRKRLKDLKGPTAALMQGGQADAVMAEALGLDDYAATDHEVIDVEVLADSDGGDYSDDPWGSP